MPHRRRAELDDSDARRWLARIGGRVSPSAGIGGRGRAGRARARRTGLDDASAGGRRSVGPADEGSGEIPERAETEPGAAHPADDRTTQSHRDGDNGST